MNVVRDDQTAKHRIKTELLPFGMALKLIDPVGIGFHAC